MDKDAQEDLESEIAARLQRRDWSGAVEAAYRGYGPEILGYVASIVKDNDLAYDIGGELCVRMLSAVSKLEPRGSFRSWAYRIARNLALDALREPRRRRGRPLLSRDLDGLVQEVRESTAVWLRTERKDALARVRAELAPDEQTLLILRLDRGLSWDEVAYILSSPEAPLRPAAARKRFQVLKEKLRALLEPEEEG
jgi:RNA polymerase sigma-70 factor (ECF subfamily)